MGYGKAFRIMISDVYGYPGYYSLLQYCPCFSRMETTNVGIVLFVPQIEYEKNDSYLGGKILTDYFKFENPAFVSEISENMLWRIRDEYQNHRNLRTKKEWKHFVNTRGNKIILTHLRPIKIYGTLDCDVKRLFDEKLEKIFKELVL